MKVKVTTEKVDNLLTHHHLDKNDALGANYPQRERKAPEYFSPSAGMTAVTTDNAIISSDSEPTKMKQAFSRNDA